MCEQHWKRARRGGSRAIRAIAAGVAILVAGAASSIAVDAGSSPRLQTEITPTDGVAYGGFGFAASMSGDGHYAVIGAPGKGPGGSAYFYARQGSTWIQQAELAADDSTLGQNFGWSVALDEDGDTALIGAPFKIQFRAQGRGEAFVFTRTGTSWRQAARLIAADGAINDFFGISVSLGGNLAIVGAAGRSNSTGAVYVFTGSGSRWTQQAQLTARDGMPGDYLGWCVAHGHGETVLVGAPFRSALPRAPVYVFAGTASGWSQQAELTPSDQPGFFGNAIAFGGGNTAVFGSGGAVYVLTGSGSRWTQQAKLVPREPVDGFGWSIAFGGGGTILVGAPFVAGFSGGSAFLFSRHGSHWTERAHLIGENPADFDEVGSSVALSHSGNTALVGADTQNGGAGAAYVFVK